MTEPDPKKNWPGLLERARRAAAPEIDVAAPVLAALRAQAAVLLEPATLADEMAAWFAGRWFKPAFAALLLAASGLAYGGYSNSEALSFLFEFSL
jgi:hypothetical protein